MLPKWLNAREATEIGTALADGVVLQSDSGSVGVRREADKQRVPGGGEELQKFLQKFFHRVDREAGPLKLNLYKRAKLANSFKWRLLEKGFDQPLVEELTRALVLRVSASPARSALRGKPTSGSRPGSRSVQALLANADAHAARGAYEEAIECYQEVLRLEPRHAFAHNGLGADLGRLGRFREAEEHFRRAIGIRAGYAEAHFNLGTLLRWRGQIEEAEMPLRRAVKLNPTHIEAQISLGTTLFLLGRLSAAQDLFESGLRVAPRHVDGLVAMGQLSAREGRFNEAENLFKRALEIDSKAPGAWVGLAGLRKMTSSDRAWLKGAQRSADSGLASLSEAAVRYAIGKYYDDVGEFARAFRSYQRANELTKMSAEAYNRDGRGRFVDDLIRVYTRETLSRAGSGASVSVLPVLVVGMPRAGTSLVEQIIASHPEAKGAGELGFWAYAARRYPATIRQEPPGEALKRKLAKEYLSALSALSAHAQRVVDKAPFNSDYLGIIHSVFPKARVIYVRRDPIDTCLSCYFQDYPPALNFTLDLSELAHYYRAHQRLVAHWHNVLPPDTLLDVPYAELVADQEKWTRRILEFLGLRWEPRCLDFQRTERSVLTASYWQVRQKLYNSSVGRWRNYEKFIGPLLDLRDPGS